jgi:hypothetical protein
MLVGDAVRMRAGESLGMFVGQMTTLNCSTGQALVRLTKLSSEIYNRTTSLHPGGLMCQWI